MTTTAMNYPFLRSTLCLAMLAVCFAVSQCTAENSGPNTNANSVLSNAAGISGRSLPSGNSVISNVIGASMYYSYCKRNGGCGASAGGTGLNSHPVGNSASTQRSHTSHAKPDAPAQTTPVTTTTTTNGELNNANVGGDVRSSTPGSSPSPPSVHGDGGHVDKLSPSVPAVPVAPLPLPVSDDPVHHDNGQDNDVLTGDDHNAATGGDHKSSEGQDSGDLLSPRTENGSAATPATTTTTTKPVKPDANRETLTRDGSGGLSGSQSLSPILQNPTNNGTPAAKPTSAHATAPSKSGEDQPSVKVTTTTTSTNTAAQPAQEPEAANQAEQDTTPLQTLKSTTSTAAPTDSKQTWTTFATEFAKEKSTALPTSLPKLTKALQSLDMKDSSIGISAFFTLSALSTFVMMALAPAC